TARPSRSLTSNLPIYSAKFSPCSASQKTSFGCYGRREIHAKLGARHAESRLREPSCSHSFSRRQQVDALRHQSLGNSLHCAPVHKCQRIPSSGLRSFVQGRPPRGFSLRCDRCGSILSHCSSVNPHHITPLSLGANASGEILKSRSGYAMASSDFSPIWIAFGK